MTDAPDSAPQSGAKRPVWPYVLYGLLAGVGACVAAVTLISSGRDIPGLSQIVPGGDGGGCGDSVYIAEAPTWYSRDGWDAPGVVVILCDDLGYGDLGCYGHPLIETPNIDRLAEEGVRFTDFHSAAPICSPSRAGLMTGRCPTRSGIYSWIAPGDPVALPDEENTIADLMQQAGRPTAVAGKWHLNGQLDDGRPTERPIGQPQPADHGFAHSLVTQNNASPSHENPKNFVQNGVAVGQIEGYSCDIVADAAVRFLRSLGPYGRPGFGPIPDEQLMGDETTPVAVLEEGPWAGNRQSFFLFVSFHEPHEPVASPAALVEKFTSQGVGEDEAHYLANVENIDRAVGKIMAELDDGGLFGETIVVFTSDNGPETLNRYKSATRSFGSTGGLRGRKLAVYEGGIRVPGIIRWADGIPAGQVIDTPISAVDLLPTIAAAARIELPEGLKARLDGTNIINAIDGDESTRVDRERPLFWHYFNAEGEPKFALRGGDWLLAAGTTFDPPGSGSSYRKGWAAEIKQSSLTTFELYNLADDRDQQTDVAASHPDRVAQMREQAEAIYAEIIAEGPDWDAATAK